MEKKQGFPFNVLPDDVMIKILKLVLDGSETSSNIANVGSIRILNFAISIDPARVRIVDLIDTRLLILLLMNIGLIDDNPNSELHIIIKEYIRTYVIEGRYNSRAHDLLDIVKSPIESDLIKEWATYLLENLITDDSTRMDIDFLTGNMKVITITDDRIYDLQRILSGFIGFNDMKYFDVRRVTIMQDVFSFTNYTGIVDLTFWDTRKVTNMTRLFAGKNFTIRGITNWNTCNVTNMEELFAGTSFNEPLNWNTSKVINMRGMFQDTRLFNQPLEWDTSKLIDIRGMFEKAHSFDQPLVWDTQNVRLMDRLFAQATAFNKKLKFDTRNVISMIDMFYNATSFNQPIEGWDTSKVIDMSEMFAEARSFNQPLEWDTSNVIYMTDMFNNAILFNQQLNWDTSNVRNMRNMFYRARSFNKALKWNIGRDTDTYDIFLDTLDGRWSR